MIDATASRAPEAKAIAPNARLVADWESVLDTDQVDAVIVAADQSTLRIEQLRRLIQAGIAVIVSHPVSLSMLECYELDMIRNETQSVVLPYLPARWHPAAEDLGAIVDEGASSTVGAVEQVLFERFLPDRNREIVLRQFARDADLLQFVAGDATKLHALGSVSGSTAAGPYANLAVQLTCENGLVGRWTVSPVEDQPGARVTLVGAKGKAILSMPQQNAPWRLETRTAGQSTSDEYPEWDPAATALEKLAAARDGAVVDPTWNEAARTVELAETIDMSLKRGRTIDLHHEEFSDIGTFKGTMASAGCALLMGGVLLVVLVAIADVVAAQAGWNRLAGVFHQWPFLLLGVFGGFLLLQLLLLIGKPRQQSQQTVADEDAGGGKV
jgi:predicted dehydrogenase